MKTTNCIKCNGTGKQTSASLVTSKAGRPDLRTGYAQLDCNICRGTGQVCSSCHNNNKETCEECK